MTHGEHKSGLNGQGFDWEHGTVALERVLRMLLFPSSNEYATRCSTPRTARHKSDTTFLTAKWRTATAAESARVS